MRIGLLVTSIGNFGKKGFYNTQEIGIAKELDKLFDEVIIYKAVSKSEKKNKSKIEGCKHSILYQIPVKSRGINGIWDCSVMDSSIDALFYFSDTQLSVPKVYKWCCKNKVRMYPYIGVIESHSTNRVKKFIINKLTKRNIQVYKKCICFAKTPMIIEQLNEYGINQTKLAPVGLDLTLLHHEYKTTSIYELKSKYGYSANDKVLLFIGRLIEEKQPINMIDILFEIRKKNPAYKLLMVGTGDLKKAVIEKIKEMKLEDAVQMVERVPNKDIWELYRLADVFINLNPQEIFGMAILEAMYYSCQVIAWEAPGPKFIVEDGISGYLVKDNNELIKKIEELSLDEKEIRKRILEVFTWENSAKTIAKTLQIEDYTKK